MKKTNLNLVVCKSAEEADHITDLIKANNAGYKKGYNDACKSFFKYSILIGISVGILESVDWKKVKSRINSRKNKFVPN